MTYEFYRNVFVVGAALAVVMLIVAVVVFFTLNISFVIGDLTGANQRKGIEDIRNQTARGTTRAPKVRQSSIEAGKVTDRIAAPHPEIVLSEKPSNTGKRTQRLRQSDAQTEQTTVLWPSLGAASDGNPTTILWTDAPGISAGSQPEQNATPAMSGAPQTYAVTIEYEILFVHTDELPM